MLILFLLCLSLVFLGLGNTFKIIFGLLAACALFGALYVGGWLLLILLASVIA
jgi:hypothetical protein